jgi:hypothetical protein
VVVVSQKGYEVGLFSRLGEELKEHDLEKKRGSNEASGCICNRLSYITSQLPAGPDSASVMSSDNRDHSAPRLLSMMIIPLVANSNK